MTVILIILALYCALFIYEIGHIIAIKINKLNAEEIVVDRRWPLRWPS